MASTDPTAPVVTVQCEVGNCHRCRGTVVSLTSAHGRPCAHECHGGDDRAVDLALERIYFGEGA